MSGCEHAEKSVNSSDDESSHVDTIYVIIVKNDRKDIVSKGSDENGRLEDLKHSSAEEEVHFMFAA